VLKSPVIHIKTLDEIDEEYRKIIKASASQQEPRLKPTRYRSIEEPRAREKKRVKLLDASMEKTEEEIEPGAAPVLKKRKIARRLTGLLFYSALVIIVVLAFSLTTGEEGNVRTFFDYSVFTILTRSMQNELPQGSLIVTEHINPADVQIGDDITFFSGKKQMTTHQVVGIIENYNNSGARGFQTKGVNNTASDKTIVSADNVAGKVIWHIPRVGTVTQWARKNIILVSVIVVTMVLLGVVLRLFAGELKIMGGDSSDI